MGGFLYEKGNDNEDIGQSCKNHKIKIIPHEKLIL
jgi:hypothetical protein